MNHGEINSFVHKLGLTSEEDSYYSLSNAFTKRQQLVLLLDNSRQMTEMRVYVGYTMSNGMTAHGARKEIQTQQRLPYSWRVTNSSII